MHAASASDEGSASLHHPPLPRAASRFAVHAAAPFRQRRADARAWCARRSTIDTGVRVRAGGGSSQVTSVEPHDVPSAPAAMTAAPAKPNHARSCMTYLRPRPAVFSRSAIPAPRTPSHPRNLPRQRVPLDPPRGRGPASEERRRSMPSAKRGGSPQSRHPRRRWRCPRRAMVFAAARWLLTSRSSLQGGSSRQHCEPACWLAIRILRFSASRSSEAPRRPKPSHTPAETNARPPLAVRATVRARAPESRAGTRPSGGAPTPSDAVRRPRVYQPSR